MKQGKTIVPHFLAVIFVGFFVIMIYVYVEAKKLNPVLLDEHGQVEGQVDDSWKKAAKDTTLLLW